MPTRIITLDCPLPEGADLVGLWYDEEHKVVRVEYQTEEKGEQG